MKKIILLIFIFTELSYSQYSIRSQYLINPEKVIGYVDSCAKFWLKAYDDNSGGFYTNIDRYGNPSNLNEKNIQTQGRDAYGYARAYMLTGNDQYLLKSKQALNFMYQHIWDYRYGGWFSTIDRYGNPKSINENKSAFDQLYALVGISAYYEATRDTTDWSWLMKGYLNNENNMWDNRPQFFGYYDNSNYNWSVKSGKSFNATVDAITTNLLYLYLMTNDNTYKNKMMLMVDNILNRLVKSMPQQKTGFVEKFDSDWNWDNTQTMTIMGHVLKTAWCLGRIYQINYDTSLVGAAKMLIQSVLQKGYDHELGGPYKDYDRTTGQMLMWGIQDTAKAWWQMEQAITAGLELYQITNDETYLKMADETLVFFMNYFVDHQYGEVYSDRSRYGKQVWGNEKGNNNKAGYHSIETGYYVYIYGKLFVKKEPFTLYYNFTADSKNREFILTPLAYPANKLKIKEVIYNDQIYTDYNPYLRKLNLPQGIGGKFKITFEINETVNSIVENKDKKTGFILGQNFPNPFNPVTTINFYLPQNGKVKLSFYDVLGKEVATPIDDFKGAGSHSIQFNASSISSGTYFYGIIFTPDNGEKQIIEHKAMYVIK